MGVLMIPGLDEEPYPTLGPQVVDWLETFLVHGPGDVRGRDYRLDDEKKGVIYRLYEVYPQGHPKAGRRRFKRAGISVRKGWAKTEVMAALAAAELHPDAPVRCDGFDAYGQPVGKGVVDPFIPLVAYTQEQSEELAFGALVVMLGEGPLADDFDLGDGDARSGVIRVIGANGKAAGKCVALSSAPDSKDGARTTFQGFDETHRQHSPRLLHAHETMLANIPKRLAADAWTIEVTTSYEPGKDSIAERTHAYAKLIDQGKVDDKLLFYYHREAADHHDLSTRAGMEAAVLDASGPAAAFTDVDYIVSLGLDPQVDRSYWERVWLNRVVTSDRQFFPVTTWDDLALPEEEDGTLWLPPDGALVTMGFDGSRSGDSTGLVLTDVETRTQVPIALWEHPRMNDGELEAGWEVPVAEVEEVIEDAFAKWDVALFYADPYFWETQVAAWQSRFGQRKFGRRRLHRAVPWHTNAYRKMAASLKAYVGAMNAGELAHNGDPRLRAHIANARKYETHLFDEQRKPLCVISKERPDSPDKIDLAMAACLSWEAWRDAMALGVTSKPSRTLHAY